MWSVRMWFEYTDQRALQTINGLTFSDDFAPNAFVKDLFLSYTDQYL